MSAITCKIGFNVSHRVAGIVLCICMVAVLGIFFLPADTGPYSSVQGPATAFKSVRDLQYLRWSISQIIILTQTAPLLLDAGDATCTASLGIPRYNALEFSCTLLC